MKRKRLFVATVLLAIAIPLVAVAWSVYRDLNRRAYYYMIDASAPLTEDLAIEFTRQALLDDGKAAADMIPVPYWQDSQFDKPEEAERLFARNTIDPNRGYVIWSVGYHVRIHRTGDSIECRVYSPK